MLIVILGEGILQWGLMIPWLWFNSSKEGWLWGAWILLLGIVASALTGTLPGAFSVLWLGSLLLFKFINKIAGQNVFLIFAGIVLLEILEIKLMGSSLIGIVAVLIFGFILFRLKETKSEYIHLS